MTVKWVKKLSWKHGLVGIQARPFVNICPLITILAVIFGPNHNWNLLAHWVSGFQTFFLPWHSSVCKYRSLNFSCKLSCRGWLQKHHDSHQVLDITADNWCRTIAFLCDVSLFLLHLIQRRTRLLFNSLSKKCVRSRGTCFPRSRLYIFV